MFDPLVQEKLREKIAEEGAPDHRTYIYGENRAARRERERQEKKALKRKQHHLTA